MSRLKTELSWLRRRGAVRTDDEETSRACGRCKAELGVIINRGAACRACRKRVCKQCREYTNNGRDWVCCVCHKHIEIQLASGEWMNEFVRRPSRRRENNVYVPPTDVVKRSLIKRSWTISRSDLREDGTQREATASYPSSGGRTSPEPRAPAPHHRGRAHRPPADENEPPWDDSQPPPRRPPSRRYSMSSLDGVVVTPRHPKGPAPPPPQDATGNGKVAHHPSVPYVRVTPKRRLLPEVPNTYGTAERPSTLPRNLRKARENSHSTSHSQLSPPTADDPARFHSMPRTRSRSPSGPGRGRSEPSRRVASPVAPLRENPALGGYISSGPITSTPINHDPGIGPRRGGPVPPTPAPRDLTRHPTSGRPPDQAATNTSLRRLPQSPGQAQGVTRIIEIEMEGDSGLSPPARAAASRTNSAVSSSSRSSDPNDGEREGVKGFNKVTRSHAPSPPDSRSLLTPPTQATPPRQVSSSPLRPTASSPLLLSRQPSSTLALSRPSASMNGLNSGYATTGRSKKPSHNPAGVRRSRSFQVGSGRVDEEYPPPLSKDSLSGQVARYVRELEKGIQMTVENMMPKKHPLLQGEHLKPPPSPSKDSSHSGRRLILERRPKDRRPASSPSDSGGDGTTKLEFDDRSSGRHSDNSSTQRHSDTASDIVLDAEKIQPEGDDYKLVFISSDSSKDSELNSSIDSDTSGSPSRRVSSMSAVNDSDNSGFIDESDWDYYESQSQAGRQRRAKGAAPRVTAPTRVDACVMTDGEYLSGGGSEGEEDSEAELSLRVPSPASSPSHLRHDSGVSTESPETDDTATPVPSQPILGPLGAMDTRDIHAMLRQTEAVQAEAQALQAALMGAFTPSEPALTAITGGRWFRPNNSTRNSAERSTSEVSCHDQARDAGTPQESPALREYRNRVLTEIQNYYGVNPGSAGAGRGRLHTQQRPRPAPDVPPPPLSRLSYQRRTKPTREACEHDASMRAAPAPAGTTPVRKSSRDICIQTDPDPAVLTSSFEEPPASASPEQPSPPARPLRGSSHRQPATQATRLPTITKDTQLRPQGYSASCGRGGGDGGVRVERGGGGGGREREGVKPLSPQLPHPPTFHLHLTLSRETSVAHPSDSETDERLAENSSCVSSDLGGESASDFEYKDDPSERGECVMSKVKVKNERKDGGIRVLETEGSREHGGQGVGKEEAPWSPRIAAANTTHAPPSTRPPAPPPQPSPATAMNAARPPQVTLPQDQLHPAGDGDLDACERVIQVEDAPSSPSPAPPFLLNFGKGVEAPSSGTSEGEDTDEDVHVSRSYDITGEGGGSGSEAEHSGPEESVPGLLQVENDSSSSSGDSDTDEDKHVSKKYNLTRSSSSESDLAQSDTDAPEDLEPSTAAGEEPPVEAVNPDVSLEVVDAAEAGLIKEEEGEGEGEEVAVEAINQQICDLTLNDTVIQTEGGRQPAEDASAPQEVDNAEVKDEVDKADSFKVNSSEKDESESECKGSSCVQAGEAYPSEGGSGEASGVLAEGGGDGGAVCVAEEVCAERTSEVLEGEKCDQHEDVKEVLSEEIQECSDGSDENTSEEIGSGSSAESLVLNNVVSPGEGEAESEATAGPEAPAVDHETAPQADITPEAEEPSSADIFDVECEEEVTGSVEAAQDVETEVTTGAAPVCEELPVTADATVPSDTGAPESPATEKEEEEEEVAGESSSEAIQEELGAGNYESPAEGENTQDTPSSTDDAATTKEDTQLLEISEETERETDGLCEGDVEERKEEEGKGALPQGPSVPGYPSESKDQFSGESEGPESDAESKSAAAAVSGKSSESAGTSADTGSEQVEHSGSALSGGGHTAVTHDSHAGPHAPPAAPNSDSIVCTEAAEPEDPEQVNGQGDDVILECGDTKVKELSGEGESSESGHSSAGESEEEGDDLGNVVKISVTEGNDSQHEDDGVSIPVNVVGSEGAGQEVTRFAVRRVRSPEIVSRHTPPVPSRRAKRSSSSDGVSSSSDIDRSDADASDSADTVVEGGKLHAELRRFAQQQRRRDHDDKGRDSDGPSSADSVLQGADSESQCSDNSEEGNLVSIVSVGDEDDHSNRLASQGRIYIRSDSTDSDVQIKPTCIVVTGSSGAESGEDLDADVEGSNTDRNIKKDGNDVTILEVTSDVRRGHVMSVHVTSPDSSRSASPARRSQVSELQSMILTTRERQQQFRRSPTESSSSLANYFTLTLGTDSPHAPRRLNKTPEIRRRKVERPESVESPTAPSPISPAQTPDHSEGDLLAYEEHHGIDIGDEFNSQPQEADSWEDGDRAVSFPDEAEFEEDVSFDENNQSFAEGDEFDGEDIYMDREVEGRFDSIEDGESINSESNYSESSGDEACDREDELRGYYNRAIDFTLHTIIEESCEESDYERKPREEDSLKADPSELEKYFYFDLGNGPADPKKYANEESEYSDTFSETSSSIFSEGVDIDSKYDEETDPAELASSRLEKYFLTEFMFERQPSIRSMGEDSELHTDESGSVGSDSEGSPSPEQPRKKVVMRRPRGFRTGVANRCLVSSGDRYDGAPSDGSHHSEGDDVERTMVSGEDEASTESEETAFDKGDGQFDTIKRRKKKKNSGDYSDKKSDSDKSELKVVEQQHDADHREDLSELKNAEALKSLMHEGEKVTKRVTIDFDKDFRDKCDERMEKEGDLSDRKYQSRDSGFIGSSDDLLKDKPEDSRDQKGRSSSESSVDDGEASSKRTDSLQVSTGKNGEGKGDSFDNDSNNNKSETEERSSGDGKVSRSSTGSSVDLTPFCPDKMRNKICRKDSFNNWSSDEETNMMMNKMRAFFKTMISNNREAPKGQRVKPPQLLAFEAKLTNLMKTVPGINDEQVKEIVEYLSSEDTWSDSYDSSDYTSSDLEGAYALLDQADPEMRSDLQEQISASCQQIIQKFDQSREPSDTDSAHSLTRSESSEDASPSSKDTVFVYQRLMSSISRLKPDSDRGSIGSGSQGASPPLLAKVMHHIGNRLVALMHEVSGGSENGDDDSLSGGHPVTSSPKVPLFLPRKHKSVESISDSSLDKSSLTSTSFESEDSPTDTEQSPESDPGTPKARSQRQGQGPLSVISERSSAEDFTSLESQRTVFASHDSPRHQIRPDAARPQQSASSERSLEERGVTNIQYFVTEGSNNEVEVWQSVTIDEDKFDAREHHGVPRARRSARRQETRKAKSHMSLEKIHQEDVKATGERSESLGDLLDRVRSSEFSSSYEQLDSDSTLKASDSLDRHICSSSSNFRLNASSRGSLTTSSRGSLAASSRGSLNAGSRGSLQGSSGPEEEEEKKPKKLNFFRYARRSSMPDTSKDRMSPEVRSTTLPRSNPTQVASTASLPRSQFALLNKTPPSVTTSTHTTVSSPASTLERLAGMGSSVPRSARYHAPGYRPPPSTTPKRTVSTPGLSSFRKDTFSWARQADTDSTPTRPLGGASTPTLGYSSDSTHTNTHNNTSYTTVLAYNLPATPTSSARSTPTPKRRVLPSPVRFLSEASIEQENGSSPALNDTPQETPTTTTTTSTATRTPDEFYGSIDTSPRLHSNWARKFPSTRKSKAVEEAFTNSLENKKSQLKGSQSFTPARRYEVNAQRHTGEAVKRASPCSEIAQPLIIATPSLLALSSSSSSYSSPFTRNPTPPPRSRKLKSSCSTFATIPECAGETDDTSGGGEHTGGGGGIGDLSSTHHHGGSGGIGGGGGQKSGSPSPLVGSVGRISGRDSVASLTSSTDTSCLTHPDEDIESLLQLNEKKISNLTPLGSRSESMASVCSAGAEGRYGTVIIRGEIELGLQYNYKEGQLEVHVAQCRDLAAVDTKRNRSDPYVKVYLLPDKSKSGKRKTKVKKHTLNPVFEEVLKFSTTMSELESRTLWVSVWHSDMFGRNDFLGEVVITLADTVFDDVSPKWYSLQDRMEPLEELSYSPRGDLILALKFVPPDAVSNKKSRRSRGALHVLVKEAKSLAAVRPHGTADPVCKGLLLPEKGKASKQKTSVCRKTLNPTWNHTLVFDDTSLQELTERAMELSVWDHDRLGPSHFLGGCRLSLGKGKHGGRPVEWMEAAGMEVKLWEQMLDRPNLWVEGSIMLRPTMDKPIYSSSMTE
ncbi:uncharacterized protein LOC127000010 isoform X4 [Eriocheir sinensis]|uniref:uncharacterized protein LOC127000010 isoform X4 n=1 Tax=Eriocheir sinensis TaxID=95602 RepID=UPI0021C7D138|nr:uncharacterized protein LOC127000010 isoform X4 [Eriocheir sinensis]